MTRNIATSISLSIAFLGIVSQSSVIADQGNFLVTIPEMKFVQNKGDTYSKTFDVRGLANHTQIEIFSSRLVDKISGDILLPDIVTFNNVSRLKINLNHGQEMEIVTTVSSSRVGSYSGFIVLLPENNVTEAVKIPFSLETSENEASDQSIKWATAIIIFIFGFGLSATIYAFGYKRFTINRFEGVKEHYSVILRKMERTRSYIKHYEFYKTVFFNYLRESFLSEIKSSNLDDAENTLQEIKNLYANIVERDNLDFDKLEKNAEKLGVSISKIMNPELDYDPSILSNMNNQDVDGVKFHFWTYLRYRWQSVILLNVGGAILGLIIALGALMQQEFIIELSSIDFISGFIIFSLGVGIDHIKQIIERFI